MSSSGTDLLRRRAYYYRHCFPHSDVFALLTSFTAASALHREFAFDYTSDIFGRYRVFDNANGFAAFLRAKCPEKIHVGGVYKLPRPTKDAANAINRRELIFDLDMTDYNAERRQLDECKCNLASKYDLCPGCWQFMQHAQQFIDGVLRLHYGFKQILWLFSGGRGLHCWVFDQRVLELDNNERRAIVNYMSSPPGIDPQQWWSQVSSRQDNGRFADVVQTQRLHERWPGVRMCPRLDVQVTVQSNRLLACPFTPHRRTGRLCVPIVPSIDTFDPLSAPSLDCATTASMKLYTTALTDFLQPVHAV